MLFSVGPASLRKTSPPQVVKPIVVSGFSRTNNGITAGMIGDEPGCGGPPRSREGLMCSRDFVAATIDPKTMSAREIARGPANPAFTGVAIATRVGDELWISSFNADRVAYRSPTR